MYITLLQYYNMYKFAYVDMKSKTVEFLVFSFCRTFLYCNVLACLYPGARSLATLGIWEAFSSIRNLKMRSAEVTERDPR
jgi:predicted PolB exonuclease-like 3'-5' exonuclease